MQTAEKIHQITIHTASTDIFFKALETIPTNPDRADLIFTARGIESTNKIYQSDGNTKRYIDQCLNAHVTPFFTARMEYSDLNGLYFVTNHTYPEAWITNSVGKMKAINEGILNGYKPHTINVVWGKNSVGNYISEPQNYDPFRKSLLPFLKGLDYQPESGNLFTPGGNENWHSLISFGRGKALRDGQTYVGLGHTETKTGEGLVLTFGWKIPDEERFLLSDWSKKLAVSVVTSKY